jgi:hypothetical protein
VPTIGLMTTVAQLRKSALALPETEEGTHFGMVAFSENGIDRRA